MDYLEFFNLDENPFRITPDPFYFYPSEEHNETLSSLNYAMEQKEGFFLATGEPGTGKTTILKVFIDNWKDKAEIALIMTPRLSPEDFLLTVLEDLNVKIRNNNKNEIMKAFRDFLLEHSLSGRRVIIVVDESQDLPDDTLEELRLLSNLETEKEKLLQIVLIGQQQLRKRLLSENLRQLNQRITVRTVLRPLTKDETSDYINYRVIKAGKGSVIFEEKVKKQIYKFSTGIPRLINLIASRAMMAAYLDGSRNIKKRHIKQAIEHLSDESYQTRRPVLSPVRLALASLLSVTIMLGGVFIYYRESIAPEHQTLPEVKYTAQPALTDVQQPSQEIKPQAATPLPAQLNEAKPLKAAPQEPVKTETVNEKAHVVTVVVKSANLRSGPSFDSEIITWVSKGVALKVMDEFTEETGKKWHKVKTSDSREGWLADKVVKSRQ